MEDLSDTEILEICMKLFPEYFEGKAVVYEGVNCLVHGCKEKAEGNCFTGSGLSIIIFPACAEHMKKMHGRVTEDLSLDLGTSDKKMKPKMNSFEGGPRLQSFFARKH